MPIPAILSAITAAVTAAPQVAELVASAKQFIEAMFKAGLISAEQQDATKNLVDAIMRARLAGVIPEHWKIQE